VILKPFLGLVFDSQKCDYTFVNWDNSICENQLHKKNFWILI
jgi:hypothetical protein